MHRTFTKTMAASVLVALSIALGGAGAGAAEPDLPPDRDGLWRALFKRPDQIPAPSENPQSEAKVSLGRDLFHDPRLSGGGQRSCASCHSPELAFSNAERRGLALDGSPLRRNVPSLYDLAWGTSFYWDGRAPSLEAQARFPIEAANEMAGQLPVIVEALRHDPATSGAFERAFPERPAVTGANILKAIASYERTLIAPRTRFDAWVEGDDHALTPSERDGFAIFVGKGGCVACHGGWRFTDDAFHDIGLPSDDPGRGAVAGGTPGLAQFKTPSLRETRHTAPYMHDGSLATFEAVIEHYSGGLVRRASLAANIRRDLVLSGHEKAALADFLRTLSSDRHSSSKP